MINFLKKRLILLLSVVSLFVLIIVPATCLADAEKVFRENNKAVVVVVAYDEAGKAISQGSGFIVRRDGVIVTNFHVIRNAKSIQVKAGGKVFNVEGIINLDKDNDIVILKSVAKDMPTVKLGNVDVMNIGEKVYVISSPKGLENTISDGILSGKRELAENIKIIQITAPISPGSSGGPVFNNKGEVIGVATFLLKDSQGLNFAMPVAIFKDKITSQKMAVLQDIRYADLTETEVYWFMRGHLYYKAKKYDQAIEAYLQAINIKPDRAMYYLSLGMAYYDKEMYSEAVYTFKKATIIDPDFLEAYGMLARGYNSLKMPKEMIKAQKEVVRIRPDERSYFHLGLAYLIVAGDGIEATGTIRGSEYLLKLSAESFKQAIRIKPDFAEAHYQLGLTYLMPGDRNTAAAMDEYKILKGLDPDLANKLFNLMYK